MLQKRESIFSSAAAAAAASHMTKNYKDNHYINCGTASIKHGYNYYSNTAEENRLTIIEKWGVIKWQICWFNGESN